MFGLKVHHHYKRRGVGTALCSQIEEELKALGAELIFVKVESSNTRAQVLYLSRLHYKQVFHQRFNILPVRGTGTRLKKLGQLEAIAKTRDGYTEDDMMLSDLETIFKSPHYLGTYLAENELGEYVGASLWYASANYELKLSRVIIDVETLKQPVIYATACLVLFAVSLLILYLGMLLYYMITAGVLRIIYVVTILYAGYSVASAGFTLVKYSVYAITQNRRHRGRVFGVLARGKRENKEALFRELIEGLKYEASFHQLDFIMLEYGKDSPIASCFTTYAHSRRYLQKSLVGGDNYSWSKNTFLDPRD